MVVFAPATSFTFCVAIMLPLIFTTATAAVPALSLLITSLAICPLATGLGLTVELNSGWVELSSGRVVAILRVVVVAVAVVTVSD